MAATITKKAVTSTRIVYEVEGDGTPAALIANATLLEDAKAGPLKDALSADYENQAAMREALLYGNPVQLRTQIMTSVVDADAEVNQPAADVDTDAVTATKPEINLQISDTAGQKFLLFVEHVHSLIRGA